MNRGITRYILAQLAVALGNLNEKDDKLIL